MWRNWAGNQRAEPSRTVVARDAGEVVDAVRAAGRDGLRVTALGSGHSFTAIGAPHGVALRVPADPAAARVDGDLVTVPAGLPLSALNALLWEHGRALRNLGDIDAQTVAGAISTGTHGTGATHRGIAAQVRALDLVTADGSLLHCSPSAHPEVFDAARVGLGALGVLVGVTLATVPAFRLRAVEATLPLEALLADLDGFLTSAEHVEFYWFPHSDVAATKRNDPLPVDGPVRGRAARWAGEELLGNAGFGAACRLARAAPALVPRLNRFVAARMAAGEYVDRSHRVFTSPRRVRFLETEYAVPRAALREAFDGVRAAAARHARAVPFPVEVRVAAADDVPLSTACGRDSAYVAVHVHRGQPHEAYFGAVEDVMTALDGRPHWGKLHTLGADDLRPRYPGFDAFTALRDRLDPDRRFTNPYLDRVLG